MEGVCLTLILYWWTAPIDALGIGRTPKLFASSLTNC